MKRALSLVTDLAEKDDRVVLLVGDLGYHLFEDFQQKFPSRFFNCGIMEQNMIGVAAGLAKMGKIPFVYSIATFPSLRCMEQIKDDLCYNNAKVIILAGGAGFNYGNLGATHHSLNAISCLQSLPGINVYSPGDRYEAEACILDAYSDTDPSYIAIGRSSGPQGFVHLNKPVNIRQGICLLSGKKDLCFLSSGPLLQEGVLVAKDMGASLYSFPVVSAIDVKFIQALSHQFSDIVTLEESSIVGGFGSRISQIVAQENGTKSRVLNIGVPLIADTIVGDHEYLKAEAGLSASAIKNSVVDFLNR